MGRGKEEQIEKKGQLSGCAHEPVYKWVAIIYNLSQFTYTVSEMDVH